MGPSAGLAGVLDIKVAAENLSFPITTLVTALGCLRCLLHLERVQ